jgi:hypothetical protein
VRRALLALVPFALACAQDVIGPAPLPKEIETKPVVPVVPITPALTGVAGLPRTVLLAHGFTLHASSVGLVDRPVTWEISDPSVARLTVGNGRPAGSAGVFTLKEGTVKVIARLGESSSEVSFTVFSGAAESSAIEIESAEFTEVLSVSDAGAAQWYLSPQIRVKGTTAADARIVGVRLTIPGDDVTRLCTTDRAVGGELAMDVFQEIYGDFELSWGSATVSRLAQAGSAKIYVADAKGVVGHIDVALPVNTGVRPWTYTGGTIANPWSC